MPFRRQKQPVSWLIAQIDEKLKRLGIEYGSLSLRQKVINLAGVQRQFRDLSYSMLFEGGLAADAALERIRLYLVQYEGQVIDGTEIEIVSGISEYARRVRQLRVEDGYQIASGKSPDPETGIDLKPDQYMLVTKEPDAEAASRWWIANRIRRKKGLSATTKLLQFLQANVGKVVTTEELAYVSNHAKEYARRVRELRTQEGYPIATMFTGRPDLKSGQYVLESLARAEPHDRHIPDEVQKTVYERDENTCQVCSWSRAQWTRGDPRVLELHHVKFHRDRGPNTPENLIVICSKCHHEVHAGRLEV